MGDGNRIPLDATQRDSSWVREKIDPDHTLPEVSLSVSPDDIGGKGTWVATLYDILYDGKVIGDVRVNADKKRKEMFTERVHVDDEYRGKGLGFGLSTYVKMIENALENGYTFRTHDWSQTEGAKHIWDILAEKGVATVIEPFVPDHTGRYNGSSVVKPKTS